MTKQIKKETGAIAIEAIISLSFFMVAVIGIMCMSLVARVQANMQYALDQTAKEISGYYYIIDKVGLASVLSGAPNAEDAEKVGKINESIDGFLSFAGATKEGISHVANDDLYNPDTYVNYIKSDNAEQDAKNIKAGFQDLQNGLKGLEIKGPGDILNSAKSVLATFAKTTLNKYITKYVASPVCRSIMYRYLGADNQSEADQLLNALGVRRTGISEGLMSVDFSNSSLLADGRTIRLVADYTIEAKELTLGVIDAQWKFRQVATTAAWIEPTEGSSKKTLTEAVK